MKRQAHMISTTLSLFVMLTVSSVHAQSDMRLKVNIPFEFSVETKVLPAGEYTVGQIVQNAQNVLLIRRVDGSASDVFMTIPREAGATPSESKLVFNRYGDRYFLSKIWTGGNDTGRELLESRVEGELLRARGALTKSASERQIVSIIAHR